MYVETLFAVTMPVKSVETYLKTLTYLHRRGRFLGLDLAPDYKPLNFLSILFVFDAVSYTFVTIYCIIEFSHSLERLVFCLVTYGFGIQVSN